MITHLIIFTILLLSAIHGLGTDSDAGNKKMPDCWKIRSVRLRKRSHAASDILGEPDLQGEAPDLRNLGRLGRGNSGLCQR